MAGGNKNRNTEKDMARILIAEDEDSLRSLIARALMQDGHEVIAKATAAKRSIA